MTLRHWMSSSDPESHSRKGSMWVGEPAHRALDPQVEDDWPRISGQKSRPLWWLSIGDFGRWPQSSSLSKKRWKLMLSPSSREIIQCHCQSNGPHQVATYLVIACGESHICTNYVYDTHLRDIFSVCIIAQSGSRNVIGGLHHSLLSSMNICYTIA